VLLERNKNSFDIVFLQEPPWKRLRAAPSTHSKEGEDIVGTPNHLEWLAIVRPLEVDKAPRIMAYVSKCLASYRLALQCDIVNHRDIMLLLLFTGRELLNLLNVYSDAQHTAITWLSRNHARLPAIAYMAGDFNSHSAVWDERVTRQHGDANTLIETAQLMGLEWARLSNHGPTHYPHANSLQPLVIDLVFLETCEALHIQPMRLEEMRDVSDHMPIVTVLAIKPDQGPEGRRSIKPESKAEEAFVDQLTAGIALINVRNLSLVECINCEVDVLAAVISDAWLSHSKEVRITKHSNPWWDKECEVTLQRYHGFCSPEDYRNFRQATKQAKHVFFDCHVSEITETNSRPWDLMGWIQQCKLPLCEAIRYRDEPCHTLDDLWGALHRTYNSA